MPKPVKCKYGCGTSILFEKTETGWKLYESDHEVPSTKDLDQAGYRIHRCPNRAQEATKQWSSSNKQGGQFTQYKVNQGLEQVTQQTQNAITQKLNELDAIKKLVHDQNILLHTMAEEIKALNNNVIAALIQLGDKQLRQQEQQSGPKKTQEFGEQGENAASNLEEYDY